MKRILGEKSLNWLLFISALGVMAFFSQQTLEHIPKPMRNSPICHFLEYAFFSGIIFRLLYLHGFRHASLIAVVLALGIGLCDELLQIGVKGRAFDVLDLAIDAAGAVSIQLLMPIKYLGIARHP